MNHLAFLCIVVLQGRLFKICNLVSNYTLKLRPLKSSEFFKMRSVFWKFFVGIAKNSNKYIFVFKPIYSWKRFEISGIKDTFKFVSIHAILVIKIINIMVHRCFCTSFFFFLQEMCVYDSLLRMFEKLQKWSTK